MGIAALVIGIVSLVLGFIPLCNYFATIPAGVGFVLGLIDVILKSVNKKPGKGSGIAGIVLCSVAIVVIVLWTAVFAAAVAAS